MLTSLLAILMSITTRARKLVLGKSWAVNSFTYCGFHTKTWSSHNNFKRLDTRKHYCLYKTYINGKKVVVLTQRFLRFVFLREIRRD